MRSCMESNRSEISIPVKEVAPSTMFVRTPCTSGARSYDGLTPSKLKRVKDLESEQLPEEAGRQAHSGQANPVRHGTKIAQPYS